MKFIVISIVAAVIAFVVAFAISLLFLNKQKDHRVIQVLLLWIGLYIFGGFFYFSFYYKATDTAQDALESDDIVTVSRLDGRNGYFFDGPGEDSAVIFYPGARIDCKAYAPLLNSLAESGIDAFAIDMPLNLALMGRNKAAMVLNSYDYDHWYMFGHSLGGVAAAAFTADNYDVYGIEGLLIFGSYPDVKLPDDIVFYSVVGSEDHVLDFRRYEAGKVNWPANAAEIIIDGGNHSQIGNYGLQRGDGEAIISIEDQQDQIIGLIHSMAGK